ncbi:hypothetical protein HMPREF9554_02233 [Treponema phagedenis F0421]|nr:hypothetical protein HMPREF9554_02233 [Treponema phagedenis F0421]
MQTLVFNSFKFESQKKIYIKSSTRHNGEQFTIGMLNPVVMSVPVLIFEVHVKN